MTNSWKSVKFMDLSMRGFSCNTYLLSKCAFRCHTVDLRVMDVTKITSAIKSFLLQDQFEKPAEMILYRPVRYGGLGVFNLKYRAMACLIRSFMEQAANPQFQVSLYHKALYQYYVLEEVDVPKPVKPPVYSDEFFEAIKQLRKDGKLIEKMTLRDWYWALVERNVTMVIERGEESIYSPSRVEIDSPDTDWETTWHLACIPGLSSDLVSFLWRLIHQVLPTQERLNRITPANTSPLCKACVTRGQNGEEDRGETGTFVHELINCVKNDRAGENLMNVLRIQIPELTAEQAMRLEFGEVGEGMQEAMTFLTASILYKIWIARARATRVRLPQVRAQLEARLAILRTTRHNALAAFVTIIMVDL